MRITDVRTTLLTGPSTNDRFLREARGLRSAAFIEVLTGGGLTGIGETYAGYFCPEVVPEIVAFFRPIVIGQDVDDIPELWRRMLYCGNYWCRTGLGMAVLTGIEAALWDLRGKREGKPVYELLGGRHHDRLRAYATGGPSNYPKDRLAQKIDYYLSLGFRALKIGAGSYSPEAGWFMPQSSAEAADFEADKLSFVRACAGRELTIMLDAHMANSPGHTWDLQTALAVARAIEPFQLFFFEEPLPYDTPSAYSELRRATVTPIAGGEPLTGLAEWRVFAERDAFDIAQPDASYVGGLDEFLRVASLFHDRGHRIATHSWGAAGALMQNVHCGFAALNTCILEIPPDYAGLHRDLLAGSFRFENGYVLPPETPGLGVVLTGEIKQRYPFVPGSGEFNSVPGKILAG